MKRNLREEPLSKDINTLSYKNRNPSNVGAGNKQRENARVIAQSMSALVARLDDIETSKGDSTPKQTIQDIKAMIKKAQLKFLKEYVALYTPDNRPDKTLRSK